MKPEDVKLSSSSSWAAKTLAESQQQQYQKTTSASSSSTLSPAAARRKAEKEAEEQTEKERNRLLHQKWDRERAERLYNEEKEKWWSFARVQYGDEGVNNVSNVINASSSSSSSTPSLINRNNTNNQRGPIDYSVWDKWAQNPDDPVSIAEKEWETKEKQRLQDEAFEKANPDFAAMVKGDIDKRVVAEEKKKARVDILKTKGNKFYSDGNYSEALATYYEGIKILPFYVPILNNIVMCHLALQDMEKVIEFTNRVLFIEKYDQSGAIKALFRRAYAYSSQKDYEKSYQDLLIASKYDPKNVEIQEELVRIELEVNELRKETSLLSSSSSSSVDASSSSPEPATLNPPKPWKNVSPSSLEYMTAITKALQTPNSNVIVEDTDLQEITNHCLSDDVRILCRTSGLIEELTRQCKDILTFIIQTTVNAKVPKEQSTDTTETVVTETDSSAFLSSVPSSTSLPSTVTIPFPTLPTIILFLISTIDNPKNRLLLRTNGLLSTVCDALCITDNNLFETIKQYILLLETKKQSHYTSPKEKKKVSSVSIVTHIGTYTTYDWVANFISAALCLIDRYISPQGDPEGRTFTVAHPFISGWNNWTVVTQELLQQSLSSSLTTTHSTLIASSIVSTSIVSLPLKDRTDCISRLHTLSNYFLNEMDIPTVVMEITLGYTRILQHLPLTDTLLVTPSKGQIASHTKMVTLYRTILSNLGSSFTSNDSSSTLPIVRNHHPYHPVTVLLQLLTILIGRSILDESILISAVTSSTVGACANLAQIEELRQVFTLPAVPYNGISTDTTTNSQGKSNDLSTSPSSNSKTNVRNKVHQHSQDTRTRALRRSASGTPASPSSASSSSSVTSSVPALHPLLDLQRIPISKANYEWNIIRGSALAALANICINQDETITILAQTGAIEILYGMLVDEDNTNTSSKNKNSNTNTNNSSMALEVRSRAAILLGRIANIQHPSIGQVLLNTNAVEKLTLWFKQSFYRTPTDSSSINNNNNNDSNDNYTSLAQYQDGLIRTLAAITTLTTDTALLSSMVEKCITNDFFPSSITFLELTVPTMKKINQNTTVKSRGPAIGNICKLFITLISVPQYFETIANLIYKHKGCEILIDILKLSLNDENKPVQKNTAIVVARLCKHSNCNQRIRELRGMEILIQISNQLL